jgi:chromosome condensin MukBEF ATPase and DNA-binding subunit MukB
MSKMEEKKNEITNYERILAAYKGRWYDQGKRHLEELKQELQDLETKHVEVADVVIAVD